MALEPPDRFDVLVLGAGSAGCVLASRLSEAPERTVALLEAGPDYGSCAAGRWPAELLDARTAPRSHDWGFGKGSLPLRAKVIGGCSSHNACFVVWGEPGDYDEWAALGNPGWAFGEFAPYLRRAEATLGIRRPGENELTPWQEAVVDAAGALGIPLLDDLNASEVTDGIAPVPLNAAGAVRWNAAFAYLDPARERSNLTILDGSLVDRVRLVGDRAVCVELRRAQRLRALTADVVVLAAGAFGSPAILLRSGVGPEPELRRLGIKVQSRLLGVGSNLVDHPGIGLRFALGEPLQRASADYEQRGLLFKDQCILKASNERDPDGTSSLHLVPRTSDLEAGSGGYAADIGVFVLKPRSSGSLRLASADPTVLPVLDHAFLSDSDDRDVGLLVDGIDLAHRLVDASAVAETTGAAPDLPNGNAADSMTRWARAGVKGYDHPVGTCRMGPAADEMAVVDSTGRLHGYDNVYVADASVMPTIPRANTHLTVLAIAERIAEQLNDRRR